MDKRSAVDLVAGLLGAVVIVGVIGIVQTTDPFPSLPVAHVSSHLARQKAQEVLHFWHKRDEEARREQLCVEYSFESGRSLKEAAKCFGMEI